MSPARAKSPSRSDSTESEIPPIARESSRKPAAAAEDPEDDGVPALAEEHERTGQRGVTPGALLWTTSPTSRSSTPPKHSSTTSLRGARSSSQSGWTGSSSPTSTCSPNGRFVRDRAVDVDGSRVTLASGDVLEPDYLVLATGSAYPFPAKTEEPDIASAQVRLRAAHEALVAADRALIVGAGPAGLELAGEIKAFYPDKDVTIVDVADDILTGPYDQALRDELRRQLDALGVELRLGSALRQLPTAPPATLDTIRITTEDGHELVADIWFRAFGVRPYSEYLEGGSLSDRRDERGYLRVDEHLRVVGETCVFAVGDVAAIPLGPKGGAGFLGDGVADAATIAEIKGRHMLVGPYAQLVDAAPTAA
jgi:thioredoxin reductase